MPYRAQRSEEQPAGAGESEPAGGSPRGSKRRGRVVKALLLGGVFALATKPEVRNRLLDALFGPEEQFDYDSVTEPVAPPIAVADEEEAAARGRPSEPLSRTWEPASDRPHDDDEEISWSPDLYTDRSEAAPREHDDPDAADRQAVPTDAPPTSVSDSWHGADASLAPPDAAPMPSYAPWSRTEEGTGPSEDAPAASEDSPAPAFEAWSRPGDAPAASEGSPAPAFEAWSRPEDAPAALEGSPAPAFEAWSRARDAEIGADERGDRAEAAAVEPSALSTLDSGEGTVGPEESKIGPEESMVELDESTVGPDESMVELDESTVEPEESTVELDESTVEPEESTVGPDESMVEPDESMVEPDESMVGPEESAVERTDQVSAVPVDAETETEPDGVGEQPAIGEADSPRSGWWIPRRRRPGVTREPPKWD